MNNCLFLILLFFSFSFSQSKVSGRVFDANKPLSKINIVAFPLEKSKSLKIATTDADGFYEIELEKNTTYEINVRLLGFHEEKQQLITNFDNKEINFVLKPKENKIDEVVIKYDYKPIEVKKDTVTFNVKSFTNGTERKLKEALEKMPGVEVEKNGNVTYQGKKVTQTMVENKSFFGGGSKLAIENIPVDALEKIEFIDHFNKVGALKEVSDSDQLAMNVKLKENKKKFLFGDVKGASEVANNNDFYLLNTSLFYYNPLYSLGYIGDINTLGKSSLSTDDVIRLSGGTSNFTKQRSSSVNLFQFSNDNTDVLNNLNQFSALNFDVNNKKSKIAGFSLFSKNKISRLNEINNQYLQNNLVVIENKSTLNFSKNELFVNSLVYEYEPNKNESLSYSISQQYSKNNAFTKINSNLNYFKTDNFTTSNTVKQNFEYHKKWCKFHTTTIVSDYSLENSKPNASWLSNTIFLENYLPLIIDDKYKVLQSKSIKNNNLNALLKHYWVITNLHHVYSNIGFSNWKTNYITSELQELSNNGSNDFGNFNFGNNFDYKLTDIFLGIEYKTRLNKLIIKPNIFWHYYVLKTNQPNSNLIYKKLFEPQFRIEYNFNDNENIVFSYKLIHAFKEAEFYAEKFILKDYNLVFKGNALLQNERMHQYSLNYTNRKYNKGFNSYAYLVYVKKTKAVRNELVYEDINLISTPIFSTNPENNLRFNGSLAKTFYQINYSFNPSFSLFNYIQKVNNLENTNNRFSQNYSFKVRTVNKKWPTINLNYTKSYINLIGQTNSKNITDNFEFSSNISFYKSFILEIDYGFIKTKNSKNEKNSFDTASISLRYQKKNYPLTFELYSSNLFNVKYKNAISVSDFLISENRTYILERAVMFSMTYKL